MAAVLFRLRVYLLIFVSVILIGTFGFSVIEGISLLDALYFCIVTIATVGYGDIHPVTTAGKVLAILLILTGVGSFVGVVANGIEILLEQRDTKARVEKMNMLIGAFYSEVGIQLLRLYSRADPHAEEIRNHLKMDADWSSLEFASVRLLIRGHDYRIDIEKIDLENLRELLVQRRDFLLRLLENPMLFEHEAFTESLRALFHLTEELGYRDDLFGLPQADYEHLSTDISRTYALIVFQWLDYMNYLNGNYPYLFSLALRTNPFDQTASPIIR
jgi:voltage-gated potassium channel